MEYLSYSPGPPLAGLVENLWSLRDAPTHAREQILPSGTIELVINLREDALHIYADAGARAPRRVAGAAVSGAYREPFVIDTEAHASIMGAHFAPGLAWPFLGVSPGDLVDAHVDLETLWPGQARELRERLCAASSPMVRFRLLESALRERWRLGPRPHAAVPVAVAELAQGHCTVAEVARRVGMSHRRFIQIFTEAVGMAPKIFGRIQRFQRAMSVVGGASPSIDWAQLAIACGYYDQSHMIRDFGDLARFSPSDLRRQRHAPVKMNHVVLPGSNSSNTG